MEQEYFSVTNWKDNNKESLAQQHCLFVSEKYTLVNLTHLLQASLHFWLQMLLCVIPPIQHAVKLYFQAKNFTNRWQITHRYSLLKYSGPSSYDRLDIRTTWVTTKILVLTYDQSLELRPACRSRPKGAVVNKHPRCVRKLQSEPRYACLWM